MLDAGCWMWDPSLQSQSSSEAGRDPLSPRAMAGWTWESHLAQEPAWTEAGAVKRNQSYKDTCIHMYFLKNRKTSPCL